MWSDIDTCHKLGIRIHLLLGGAGGAFTDLFENFDVYYGKLYDFIKLKPIISGINLDVEETVSLSNIEMLITKLKTDFGNTFELSMTPLAGSLISNDPGMGGFSYKDLYNKCGNNIDYLNIQCYDEFSLDILENMIKNKYPIDKLVMCHIFGQDMNSIILELLRIKNAYGDKSFAGVSIWEYYMAPPAAPSQPQIWCEIVSSILHH